MADIDKLSIDIEAKVNSNEKKLDKLIESLNKLDIAIDNTKIDTLVAKINSIQNFSSIADTAKGVNKLANSLNKLNDIKFTGFSSKINTIINSLTPLNNIQATNIPNIASSFNKFYNSLSKLYFLDTNDIAIQINAITTAIRPLTDEMLRGGNVAQSYATIIGTLGKNVKNVATNTKNIANNTKKAGFQLTKVFSAFYLIRRASTFIGDMVLQTAGWTENLNLFANSFGQAQWQDVLDWTQEIAQNFGFASNELIKFTGLFKQLSNSLGVADQTGTELSKTLTKLALDFASFYNVDLERTFATFQSAIFGGQTKGARQLFGVEIAYQTLDEILKTNEALKKYGVTAKQLTQDQKALLRSIQFLTAGQNAFGDMEKTINSTANQIRVMQGAIENLKLALGDMLLAEPFQKILTYVNGIIIGITEIIRTFVPFNKEVSFANQVTGLEDMNEELEQVNSNLLSFDKFEALSKKDSSVGNLDITKALTEELRKQQERYEEITKQMGDINNKAVEIAEKIRDWFVIVDKDNNFVSWTNQATVLSSVLKGILITLIAIKGINIFSNLIPTLTKLPNIFSAIKFSMLEVLTTTKGLSTNVTLLGRAFSFILNHPIIIAIGAIIALLTILYTKNEQFRESVNKLFKTIIDGITPILNLLVDTIVPIIELFTPTLNYILDALANSLIPIIELLTMILLPLFKIIESWLKMFTTSINIIIKLITGDFIGAFENIKQFFSEFKEYFINIWKEIINVVASVINFIGNAFINVINTIIDGLNILITPISKISKYFGGKKIEIPKIEAKVDWQPFPEYKADGGTFDLRGGVALGVVNEYGNDELVYSNNARQIEVSNQESLETSFANAMYKVLPQVLSEYVKKGTIEIVDKTENGVKIRENAPKYYNEMKRVGLLK